MKNSTVGNPRFPITRAIVTFVLLFVFAIPWWWRFLPEMGERTVLGAPLWFVTAAVGSLLISVVSARFLSVAWDCVSEDRSEPEGSSHE